ncbi:MAG: chorismate mutase [Rhodobacteraceae bacterium]|nr:chorismate mutase [Paracoccaceae bacterium]
MKNPESCDSMAELRTAIDALDAELVGLLAKRAHLIDRASELKTENGWPARIAERVEEVAQNARKNANATGFDPDLAEKLWRELIDWSIAREEQVLGLDS